MFPTAINVIQVGKGLPKDIQQIKTFNTEILSDSRTTLKWHCYDYDSSFRTCAIQAEYLKLVLLSHVQNEIVCDWDVLFLKHPEFSECLKIGTREKSGADSFFVYVPKEYSNHVFSDALISYEKIGKSNLDNGFSKTLFESLYVSHINDANFPKKQYIHVGTRYSCVLRGGWKEFEDGRGTDNCKG